MLPQNRQSAGTRLGQALVVALLALLSQGKIGADDEVSGSESGIVGRFSVGKAGRPLLLPVMLGEREILCLVDTGATCSGFDVSLSDILGPPQADALLRTAAGTTAAQTHRWPDARIRGEAIGLATPIVCVDLEPLRRASNAEIFGFIGMDILRRCRFLVDFDRGIAHFVDSIPTDAAKNLGTKVPVQFRTDGTPLVIASTPDGEAFAIDTGADTTSISSDTFDALLGRADIQLKSGFSASTAAGVVRGNQGRLRTMTIGPFSHSNLRVSRMQESAVGLRYLSRYRVVFDFPANAMYLRKGAQFDKSEPTATSGVSLLWIDGELRVDAVRQDGPAAKAGFRVGDVLATVNNQPAHTLDQIDLRELLTSTAGVKIPIVVRRGESEIEVQLVPSEE